MVSAASSSPSPQAVATRARTDSTANTRTQDLRLLIYLPSPSEPMPPRGGCAWGHAASLLWVISTRVPPSDNCPWSHPGPKCPFTGIFIRYTDASNRNRAAAGNRRVKSLATLPQPGMAAHSRVWPPPVPGAFSAAYSPFRRSVGRTQRTWARFWRRNRPWATIFPSEARVMVTCQICWLRPWWTGTASPSRRPRRWER